MAKRNNCSPQIIQQLANNKRSNFQFSEKEPNTLLKTIESVIASDRRERSNLVFVSERPDGFAPFAPRNDTFFS
jgi:hypothetical protein